MRDGQKFKMQYLIKIIHLFKKTNIIKDLPVKEGNSYFNWTNTSHMQGYDENGNKIEDGLKNIVVHQRRLQVLVKLRKTILILM